MRNGWAIVVAFALILRSLLAPGIMLEAGPQAGTFTVVLCSEHGSIVLDLDGDGRPLPSKQRQAGSFACPYAASSPLALLATPTAVIAPPTISTDDVIVVGATAPVARHGLPQPARGPPHV